MSPLGATLKKKDPDAFVSWIVNDSLATLPALCDDVDELILFKRNQWNKPSGWLDFLRFLRGLKRMQWDTVIDAQGLFRSALCAWFAGNGSNVYGFADAREGATLFYDHVIAMPSSKVHAVDKNLHLLSEVLGTTETYSAPTFTCDPNAVEEIDALIGKDSARGTLMTVTVGSRWPSKNWPPEFFADVIDRVLTHSSARIVLVGSPDEIDIGRAVEAASKKPGLVNLIGKTSLSGMVELIRRSATLMTNDSGPMHIAAAMSVPTVTFFGPTDPDKTGPYGTIHTVFKSDLACSPCFNRICPLPVQTCVKDTVSPDDAAKALLIKLKEIAHE